MSRTPVAEGTWARGTLCVYMVPSPVLTLVGAAMLISLVSSAVRLINVHSLLEITLLLQAVTATQHTPPYL